MNTKALRAALATITTAAAFVVGPGAQMARATFPGENGRIAFESNGEILTINPDGTSQSNLTFHTAIDGSPTWTVDGNQILFESNRDGDYDIYQMNSNGTDVINLTDGPSSEGNDRYPVPTPDGLKFLFVSSRSGNQDIFLANINGTSPVNLSVNAGADSFPAISPDGSKVAFASNRDGNSEIYVMNIDGTGQTNITNNAATDTDPSWSPDGTQIAFSSTQSADGNRDIFVMNSDGTSLVNITNHSSFDSAPAWSADGTLIAFASNRSGTNQIATTKPDGTEVVRLTNNPDVDDTNPDWQPCPPSGCVIEPAPTTTTVNITVTKKKVKADGTLSPPHPGSEMTVTLFKKKEGDYKKVDQIKPVLTDESAYDVSFTRPDANKCKVTAKFAGDDDHEPSKASSKFSC